MLALKSSIKAKPCHVHVKLNLGFYKEIHHTTTDKSLFNKILQ
ncbi:MAG: hypothetical protein ACTSRA_12090 [Promethearchaeota archaeon]